jgi:hypothetical protein
MTPTGEVIALGLTLGVHLLGAAALVAVIMRDSGASVRDWWPHDDDGGTPRDDPRDPALPSGGGDELPLPDAAPSSVRLREPGAIGDAYPRRPRRPAHPPATPERDPEPV